MVKQVRKRVELTDFWKEQQQFDEEIGAWEKYCDIFHATHGRMPVLYDLYCGEGPSR